MKEQKLRFGVGNPDGPRSAIWSLIGQEQDAYLAPLELKTTAKISLHLAYGEFSWGYDRIFFDKNREEIERRAREYGVEVTVEGRDFERWKSPAEVGGGVTLPVRIYVANEVLQKDPA